jgi:urease accessory protein
MALDYLILQLCDSAFPTGGFAHSAGLEAAWQQGEIGGATELRGWLLASLRQAGHGSLPFIRASRVSIETFEALDDHCDTFLLGHVANKASRAQGQAMLASAARTFERPALDALAFTARSRKLPTHLAPVFGAVCDALGIAPDRASRLFLFVTLRGAISAAVRLGVVGPMEAQRIQQQLAAPMEEIAVTTAELTPDDVAQTSPLLEILQTTQDRLYSRLFIS